MLSRSRKRKVLYLTIRGKLFLASLLLAFILFITKDSPGSEDLPINDPLYPFTIYALTILKGGNDAHPKPDLTKESPRSKSKTNKTSGKRHSK